jgi:hypothetical protein
LPAGYNPQVEELRQREFRRLQHVYAGRGGGSICGATPRDVTQPPLPPPGWQAWVVSNSSCAVPAPPVSAPMLWLSADYAGAAPHSEELLAEVLRELG